MGDTEGSEGAAPQAGARRPRSAPSAPVGPPQPDLRRLPGTTPEVTGAGGPGPDSPGPANFPVLDLARPGRGERGRCPGAFQALTQQPAPSSWPALPAARRGQPAGRATWPIPGEGGPGRAEGRGGRPLARRSFPGRPPPPGSSLPSAWTIQVLRGPELREALCRQLLPSALPCPNLNSMDRRPTPSTPSTPSS